MQFEMLLGLCRTLYLILLITGSINVINTIFKAEKIWENSGRYVVIFDN